MGVSSALPVPLSEVPVLLLALGLLSTWFVVTRLRPRIATATWISIICFVPIWVVVPLKYEFPVGVLLTMLFALAIFPTVPRDVSIGDWLLVAFFVVSLVPFAFGMIDKSSWFTMVFFWGAAYLLGRTLPLRAGLDWIYGCIAIVFTVVAILAIVEFIFSWNPFVMVHTSSNLFQTWGTIQDRGGHPRAEGAFGHSIALGASVALIIPLVVASRFEFRTKAFMIVAMLACEIVTLSRIGMVTAGLSVALMVIFGKDGLSTRLRGALVTILVVIAIAASPTVLGAYSNAGAEATNSADYRLALTELLPHISLLGQSPDMHVAATGTLYVGDFRSIDDAAILLGVRYGWIPLILAACLLAGAIYLVICRTASAATVAVVAQIPAFISVALITQYQVMVWFIIGLAVCAQTVIYPGNNERQLRSSGAMHAAPKRRSMLIVKSMGTPVGHRQRGVATCN